MATLLVSWVQAFLTSCKRLGPTFVQVFKIVAPFVILASVFATLNARLHLPPFSLFLIALTLTDGE